LQGHYSQQFNTFAIRKPDGQAIPYLLMSTSFVYSNLVDRLSEPPHSLTKFQPIYGALYWKDTWQQVAIMPLDRKARDLNWKLAHGVLYTADRQITFFLLF
jgi:hypothetical protein